MERNTKIIIGVLAAGAVGMLIAPEKGKKLVASVKDSLGEVGERLTEVIEDGHKYIGLAKKEIIEQAVGLKDDVHDDLQNRFESTKEVLSAAAGQLLKNILTRAITKVGTNYLRQVLK